MIEEEESGGGNVEEGLPPWMGTFADLMSLLLTFFILILSFANMDVIKFSAAVASLQDAFGTAVGSHEYEGTHIPSPITLSTQSRSRVIELEIGSTDELRDLREDIEEMVERSHLENLVEVEESDRGVVVRVIGQLLFDPGSADLRPESFVLLTELALLIKSIPGPVSIEGHTDDTGTSNLDEISNWRLSAGRAISVLDNLTSVHEIDAQRLNVSGYSATRPLVPNDSVENREVNRRVEFVFVREEPKPSRPAG